MTMLSLSVFCCIWWKSIVSCLSVVGETCSLTCVPLLGVYLPSRWVFIHCVSVGMDEASLHCYSMFFWICFFLQTLLSFSNFSLLQLGFIFSLTLTFKFSFLLSIAFPVHWQLLSPIPLWCFTVPMNTEKCLCFRDQSLCSRGSLPGGSTTHQRVPVAYYVTSPASFFTSVKWEWEYSFYLIALLWRLNELFHIKYLDACLAHRKCLTNVCCCHYLILFSHWCSYSYVSGNTINIPDKWYSLEYIWKMQLFKVGLVLPFFSVVFQAGQFEVEDLEAESPWWSGLSFVRGPLPACMPCALSPDQSVRCSDILLLQVLSAWSAVWAQVADYPGACGNAGLRPYPRPAELESAF